MRTELCFNFAKSSAFGTDSYTDQTRKRLLRFLLCSLKGKVFSVFFFIFANFDTDWFITDSSALGVFSASLSAEIRPVPGAAAAVTAVTENTRGVFASLNLCFHK